MERNFLAYIEALGHGNLRSKTRRRAGLRQRHKGLVQVHDHEHVHDAVALRPCNYLQRSSLQVQQLLYCQILATPHIKLPVLRLPYYRVMLLRAGMDSILAPVQENGLLHL